MVDTQLIDDQTRIRIELPWGDLLCMYNEQTREIEIMPVRRGKSYNQDRKIWCIPMDEVRSLGARNVISDNPRYVYKVKKFIKVAKSSSGKIEFIHGVEDV